MAALWEEGPLTADELVRKVGQPQDWGEATVKTLINRLMKKKALVSEKSEGRTRYRPLVSREAYVTSESQGLLDRLFGGQVAPLVAHFTRTTTLSPEDRARLRRLLDDLDAEEGE